MRAFRCISVELNAKRLCKFALQSPRTSNICGCTKTRRYLAALLIVSHRLPLPVRLGLRTAHILSAASMRSPNHLMTGTAIELPIAL